ncbi:SNF2 family N-terminal domain-domain-containing protein [Kockovaella imperatae]|uniref:SNF2 family N-terminal domain-domain-containing protein n=1 Tax=Kockovaella imperatae TaxID=4999 RepID=A0A1Y1U7X4_9TREE|nr:SNF2 family N-terminal domain-domain-containing protein [Kockovaella imperatae]ORX33607.1 SNF2 family N-terminal domain-domain-containing protein [Kockovaella imperatae]
MPESASSTAIPADSTNAFNSPSFNINAFPINATSGPSSESSHAGPSLSVNGKINGDSTANGGTSHPSAPGTTGPIGIQTEEQALHLVRGMDPAKFNALKQRASELLAAGQTVDSSSELHKILYLLKLQQRSKELDDKQNQAQANGPSPAGPSTATPTPAPANSTAMTPQQIAQLRSQAASFSLLNRGQPVPSYLQDAAAGIPPPGSGGQPAEPNPIGSDLNSKVIEKTVDAVVESNVSKSSHRHPPYAMEFDTSSAIYPFNAYTDPGFYANRNFDAEISNPLTKMQRLIVPNAMPKGLDPYYLMEERNRFVETRMAWRMKELEELDATFGTGESGAKEVAGVTDKPTNGSNLGIRARIELLQLRLLGKQRLLREDVVRAMHGATQIPVDRSQFRRFRTHHLRDARETETAERRQRTEREQRGKQRHLAYINSICEHGQALIGAGVGTSRGSGAEKAKRMGRAMMRLHQEIEKEEQRRIERLAKERLKALKNDDEEGYLALLGEAKDSRISHLLKQTDSYLETLAAAVVDQQNDVVHRDQMPMSLPFETEDGPASEAMFGARRQDGEEENAERKAGKVDYYAVAHRIQEKVTGQAKMLTGGTLKDYQVKGLQWMISLYNNRLNGILADEMGLGKTIQTISLITYLIEKKRQPGPFLVIVPLSTLTNWTMEFERWAPSVRTVILKGSPVQRREQYGRLRAVDFQVCLTTYEYVIKERPLLSKIKWIHMIIDEGHRMKNVKSKLSQTLNEYYSTKYRLILTGTPLQNNLPELWALLNFALPKIFNSVKSFDEWFNAPFANTGGEKMEMNEEEALLVIKRLHKVLRPFLLRRLKKDVESELPDKVEKVIYTKMSALQWKLYESVKKYKTLPTDMSASKHRRTNLQNAIMQLRKICNHPFVFREVDEDFSVGNNIDEQIVRTAGKFELLDRILPKLFKTGHKVLIFFQMTEIMTIIADFFDYRGWRYCRLDGSTKADDRQALLSSFNDPASPYQVFILSTRAGGLGLNLQSADTVIIYDTDWNPHADLQAQDRAHRIGQKKEVRVLRLISSQTVEELVLQRAQRKLEIDGKVIQAGKFDDVTTGAEYEELLAKAFETNADDDNEEANELDDEELNELLARGDHELEIFTQMDKERKELRAAQWKEEGHKGPVPPPLMQESELPPFYRRDIGEELAEQAQAEELGLEGRGRRAKEQVRYTDGLTDDQWLNAMEDSDDDIEEAAERKRKRSAKKQERKRVNEMLAKAEAEGKPLSSIKLTLDVGGGGGSGGGKAETPVGKSGAKKRGRPSASATPSVAGEDMPLKRRKTDAGGPSPTEITLMWKLYNDTNALKSEAGEDLNQYFLKPVDRKVFFDYYDIIKNPMTMNQIRRRIGKDTSYGLSQLSADMHLIWDNARTYNEDGSWVYSAADQMQAFFDNLWAEQVPKLEDSEGPGGNGASHGTGNGAGAGPAVLSAIPSGMTSGVGSGSSTPMYKPQDKATPVPTKIKLNMSRAGAGAGRSRMAPDPDEDDDEDEDDEEESGEGGQHHEEEEEEEEEAEDSESSDSDDDY